MRNVSITILFCLALIKANCQTPDILTTEYNTAFPGASWQFSFVHITDIHIGEGSGDYGTPGYNDTLAATNEGAPLLSLRRAVKWINQNAAAQKIRFVMITGDFTRSGERSQLLRFKQVVDSLDIPYIPLIGNHDVWPYCDLDEASTPIGDSLVNVIFKDVFDSLALFMPDWSNGTRLNRTWVAEESCYSYFQNFSFTFGSYLFLNADFATRTHAPLGYQGIGPEADIFNFAGGTWPWLKQSIIDFPRKGYENILLFSHYPPTKDAWAAVNSFSYGEYDDITNFMKNYTDNIGAWFAGHIHRDSEYGISTWLFSPTIANGYECNSNKEFENGHFRIVKVWDTASVNVGIKNNSSIDNYKIYPNPCKDYIKISNLQNKETIAKIIDINGKILFETKEYLSKEFTISTAFLEEGVYFLNFINRNNSLTRKFVKIAE